MKSCFLAVLFLFAGIVWFVFADETSGEKESSAVFAILLRGPFSVDGIDFLEPNTIPVFVGTYAIADHRLEVTFTRSFIIENETWAPVSCAGLRLQQIPDNELFTLYYHEVNRYSMFFRFPFDYEPWCDFITTFRKRFTFFLAFTKQSFDIPFPALLELES